MDRDFETSMDREICKKIARCRPYIITVQWSVPNSNFTIVQLVHNATFNNKINLNKYGRSNYFLPGTNIYNCIRIGFWCLKLYKSYYI